MAILKLLVGLSLLMMANAKSKICKKKEPKLKKCLENGYRTKILEDCATKGQEMKGKKQRKCYELEKVITKKCKSFQCENNGKKILADIWHGYKRSRPMGQVAPAA